MAGHQHHGVLGADGEIASIVHIANAAGKLGVAGHSQAVHRAATLGYIGAVPAA